MIDVQDFYAALVESCDTAIAAKNLSGIVIIWNSGATRLFGYTAQEMVGQDIHRLLPEDRR
ncbi:PAS domain S-box protein, partial [Xanthomonas citri pv. citri]